MSAMLVSAANMDPVYEWKYIDYVWESDARRQQAIDSGEYDFSRILPMDVDKAPDGRIFISTLGMHGVPASLVIVTDQMGPSGPLVKPYPDWSYFKTENCDSIQNVYRIAIDECERLWVLDTGFLEGERITCEPQLLAFDLKTDRLIERIKIPNHIARGSNGQTMLATPIVETIGQKCENTTVFMADPMGKGLVIWNGVRLFRLENPLFGPTPGAENITSGNFTVNWPDTGIVTMDLSPKIFPGEQSFLYFHALSSLDLYAASTEVLKRSTHGMAIKFLGSKNVLSSQAIGVAFSSEGTLFLGMTKESAIACWNKYRDLTSYNIEIVAQDSHSLEYVNGLKVIRVPHSRDEEVWALSNRFIAFQLGQLDANDYNFRVLKGSVKKLITGTSCELPRKTQNALESINRGEESVLIVTD
ncbi:major royal jelly protein 1-like isoform X2 [Phymastichus coffea]|uniref:major royal jelly protein 1-like isoform X2 n=1 Tax=Phymastichus coffea TaxID=108790 RepID=UPI00273B01E7|nr:major royal jelly protein 1-like isoform X2 [Phymastichus coffea]